MKHAAVFRRFWTVDELSHVDAQSLLAAAATLKRAPNPPPVLAGKQVAMLCSAASSPSAEMLATAVAAIGARFTRIRTSEPLAETRDQQAMARLMGKLYDAIFCDDIDEPTMRALDRDSGVPVLNGVAHAAHPTRLLADVMTMQDAATGPLFLCVAGQPRESVAAWQRMAPLVGVRICARTDPAPHGGDDEHASGFFFDPDGQRCEDGGPALRKRNGARSAALAREQTANHALLVRALLLQALG